MLDWFSVVVSLPLPEDVVLDVVDRPAGRMTDGRSSLTVAPVGVLLSADETAELARPAPETELPAPATDEGFEPLSKAEDEGAGPAEDNRVEGAAMMSCVCEGIQTLSSVEAEDEAGADDDGAATTDEPRAPPLKEAEAEAEAAADDDEAAGMAQESDAEADPEAEGPATAADDQTPLALDTEADDPASPAAEEDRDGSAGLEPS